MISNGQLSGQLFARSAFSKASADPKSLVNRLASAAVFAAIAIVSVFTAVGIHADPTSSQDHLGTTLRSSGPAAVREVVVVGGGLAGLSATRDLLRAGVDVVTYEASERFGGRVMTVEDPFGLGLRINAGAELVDSTHTEIRNLSRELGVAIVDRPVRQIENRVDLAGRWVTEADHLRGLASQNQRALAVLAGWSATEDVSMAEKLRAAGASASLYEYIARAVESEWGRTPDQLSRQVFLDTFGIRQGNDAQGRTSWRLELLPHNDEKSFFSRGSESLVEALVRQIPQSRRALGWKLRSVEEAPAPRGAAHQDSAARYVLRFENERGEHRIEQAAKLVLALPEAALREIEFRVPGLSTQVTRPNSQWGQNSKIVLYFRSRDWSPFAGLARDYRGGLAFQMWDSSLDARGPGAAITLYTGRLAHRSQIESAVQHALNLLRTRGEGAHYVGYATHEWTRSYPGANRPGPRLDASRVSRHGSIYFAGDAWSEDHKGYMNGAVEAGRARALEILLTSGKQCAVMFR